MGKGGVVIITPPEMTTGEAAKSIEKKSRMSDKSKKEKKKRKNDKKEKKNRKMDNGDGNGEGVTKSFCSRK